MAISSNAMNDSNSAHSTGAVDASDAEVIADVEKLRSILVRSEREDIKRIQEQLDALQFRVTDVTARAEDTSAVLIQATSISQKRDNEYSNALKPMVVEQFQTSSRENPEIMAEALFPILGPAIRKMIASMLSRDSKKSKRTYKFEQLFLIEKESGLPICHAKSGSAETKDADMVSGMLSAIQSFVQDAFSTQEFDGLNTLQLGELSVWIEWGPTAVVAAVIRGVAPENCRTALQQLLEDIHTDYEQQLSSYEGDAAPFDAVKSDFILFMDNHDSRLRNKVKKIPEELRKKFAIAGLILLFAIGWLIHNQYDKNKWNKFVAELDSQPGIVITSAERGNHFYTVRGLKDPLALNPTTLLVNTNLDHERVVFELEPYQAMYPEFTLKRIESVLFPPTGVTLELDGNILRINGAKSKSWIEDATRLARQFSQVSHVTIGPATE